MNHSYKEKNPGKIHINLICKPISTILFFLVLFHQIQRKSCLTRLLFSVQYRLPFSTIWQKKSNIILHATGAGVTGLTSAISLLRKGYKDVTVVSKHVPGDWSSEYTSPWAGASILTVAAHDDYRLQGTLRFCLCYI